MKTVALTASYPPSSAAQLLNAETAVRYRIVPIAPSVFAFGDPRDIETIDTLRYLFKDPIQILVALPNQIDSALARLYPEHQPIAIEQHHQKPADESPENVEPIIKLVNLLIAEGFSQRASDIHLEPLASQFRIRYRIDGRLREIESPPHRLHPSIISRIKIMAGMKISEKRLPQDGRIEIRMSGRTLNLRVSSIPTNHGESIVMRILDKQNLTLGLPNLGLSPDDLQTVEQLIRHPDGIILVTGPTGSGKTTSLYAALNQLNQPDRKIITVEDPVEYQLDGINQVQVRPDIGLTFSTALRSMMRQSPNIIMIGEIRDRETAEIAINAALTGHLVLSTLHTNDAPAAITRLSDIGVKPFLISSSVRGIMAQRLVRTICSHCKVAYEPTTVETRQLKHASTLWKGSGCTTCDHSGYIGRKGIFELLTVNDEIRQMIYSGATATQLRTQAQAAGMCSL
ncbi:MAG: GspE/PulE family protein, partial [Kiritimatiellaceae bacterium]|nr:GspE/PulE family protein [Kiritimatiellaceae bacterium]